MNKGFPLVEYVDRCVIPMITTDFGMAVCKSTVWAERIDGLEVRFNVKASRQLRAM